MLRAVEWIHSAGVVHRNIKAAFPKQLLQEGLGTGYDMRGT